MGDNFVFVNNRSSHPVVFLGKSVLKICTKFTREHQSRSAISMKLPCNFIEITLRHGCSPVNLLYVCVCLYSSTVKASSVCKMSKTYLRVRINDLVFWILVDCVMPSSIIAVSENAIFHLQRRKLLPLSYWRENDMI